ncbi:MAG: diguanylate cyclase domain-containing protein [Acidimicrobiia bacterium]
MRERHVLRQRPFQSDHDNFGHEVGDEVLVEVALRLRSVTRAWDTVGAWRRRFHHRARGRDR